MILGFGLASAVSSGGPVEFTGDSPRQLQALLNDGNDVVLATRNLGIFEQHSPLIVPDGVTLYVRTILNIQNRGELLISGTVVILDGGRVNNQGTGDGGTITIEENATLVNNGMFENTARSTLINRGTIYNYGDFDVRGVAYNYGDIYNNIGSRRLLIDRSAVFTNNGKVENRAYVHNRGRIYNENGSNFINYGGSRFINHGPEANATATVNNMGNGNFQFHADAEFYNRHYSAEAVFGPMNVDGDTTLRGFICIIPALAFCDLDGGIIHTPLSCALPPHNHTMTRCATTHLNGGAWTPIVRSSDGRQIWVYRCTNIGERLYTCVRAAVDYGNNYCPCIPHIRQAYRPAASGDCYAWCLDILGNREILDDCKRVLTPFGCNHSQERLADLVVTFDTVGGSPVPPQQFVIANGRAVIPPVAPERSGYTFGFWMLDGVEFNFNTPITRNITLVAHWTPIDFVEPTPFEAEITKQADRRVTLIGHAINYTITVENVSDVPMVGFVVEDELDTDLVRFAEGSLRLYVNEVLVPAANATHTNGVIRVALGTLQPGDIATIAVGVIALQESAGEVVHNNAVLRHPDHYDIYASAVVDVLSILPNPTHYAYLIGYPDGTVQPRSNISRAEVSTIFFRLISDEYRAEIWEQANPFSDVALERWYNNAISTMANAEFLQGYPDGTFRPRRAITRAEFATIVSRFMNIEYEGENRFSDVGGHWAVDAINTVAYVGWVTGYPDGTFRPNNRITRAEAATIVNRIFLRNPETPDDLLPGMITWPDNANPDRWYFTHIQEATNSHRHEMKECGIHERWTELIAPRNWVVLQRPDSTPESIMD